jgi:hypothetical protein
MSTKPPFGWASGGRSEESDSANAASNSGDPVSDGQTEILVDASDDVTVEASEDITSQAKGNASDEGEGEDMDRTTQGEVHEDVDIGATPPPVSSSFARALGLGETPAPMTRPASAPTLLGFLSPSLPLPGVTAAPVDEFAEPGEAEDEVTVLARPLSDDQLAALARPSVTDDDEEETKVEPAETVARATQAPLFDEVATALSDQASAEREKALRRSSLDIPLHQRPREDLEFADPDDDAAIISADPIEDDDEDAIDASADDEAEFARAARGNQQDEQEDQEESATASYSKPDIEADELASVLAPRRPPLGSPAGSGFGGGGLGGGGLGGAGSFGSRLPTPSAGLGRVALPAPVQAPAPASSPFAPRLAPVPAGSPYGGRGTASAIPALQIPAPSGSGAVATGTASASGLFRKVQLPLGGLVASLVAVLGGGLLIGVVLGRSGSPSAVAPMAQPTPPASTVVVQPVAPPPAPTASASPTPAAEKPAPLPAQAGAPTPPPSDMFPPAEHKVAEARQPAAEAPIAPPPPAPKAVKRVARPKRVVAEAGDDTGAPPPAPKPKAKAKAKVWVDPFAQ